MRSKLKDSVNQGTLTTWMIGISSHMNQDDRLPPRPSANSQSEFALNANSLPPLSPRDDGDLSRHDAISDLQSDSMTGTSLSRLFERFKPSQTWTPLKLMGLIFVASFILSIMFTSAILAGLIEIHPSAIKNALKTLVGKG